jgi:pSer/pThr/pTyr-binding forkhead associated (FHA) protein
MWLTITRGDGRGHTVEVADRPLSIGRDPDCDIVVPDARVSRRHAEVRPVVGGGAEVVDLGSSNGTFVDGTRVTEPVPLTAGQSLQVGDTVLRADPMRPGGDKTVIGESAVPPPPPPPDAPAGGAPGSGQRRPTTEVLNLRRSVRRNTVIGVAALAAVVVAAGVITWIVLSGGGDDERSVAEIVDDSRDSTVEVLAAIDGDIQGGGTGWVYDAERGLIVTNAHVVNAGTEFEVALEEDEDPREAELVAVAPCEDLAVLRTDDTDGLRTLPLGDQESLDLGDTIVALGFPGSASREGNLTATSGVVSVARTAFDLEAIDVPQYPNVI